MLFHHWFFLARANRQQTKMRMSLWQWSSLKDSDSEVMNVLTDLAKAGCTVICFGLGRFLEPFGQHGSWQLPKIFRWCSHVFWAEDLLLMLVPGTLHQPSSEIFALIDQVICKGLNGFNFNDWDLLSSWLSWHSEVRLMPTLLSPL